MSRHYLIFLRRYESHRSYRSAVVAVKVYYLTLPATQTAPRLLVVVFINPSENETAMPTLLIFSGGFSEN